MKSFFKWFAGVFTALILFVLLIFIIITSLIETEPTIHDPSYLSVSLSGSLPEYTPPDPFAKALGQRSLDLKKVRDVLEKAVVDERIKGVILEIGMLQSGYGKRQELRNLIQTFKQSDKPIYAYLSSELSFTGDYYVASACDSVFMPHASNLFLTGVSSEVTFYKGFFDKIGVDAEFVHVGKYKNAPDAYTREDMSDAQRSVLENLVNRYYRDILVKISKSRHLEESAIESIVNDKTGLTAADAKQLGLIDAPLSFSEIVAKLDKNDNTLHRLPAEIYADIPASSLGIRNKTHIAVIHCSGLIASGGNSDDALMGTVSGSRSLARYLEEASSSNLTKAIVLRIDSPGGSASASEQIWQAIKKAGDKKPIVASISDYGASGGYYIATAADTILAAPASLVGSIGIFAGKFNVQELYKKLGLNEAHVNRGRHADIFSLVRPWSASERAIVKRLIVDFYKDFVKKVADGRDMEYEHAESLAQGRVYTGDAAVNNRLLDGEGYFYTAIETAKEMAGIDSATSVRLVYYPEKKSLLNEVFKTVQAKERIFTKVDNLKQLALIENLLLMQNKPMALLPFRVTWR